MQQNDWVYWCIGGSSALGGAAVALLRLDPALPRYAHGFASALSGFAIALFAKALFPDLAPPGLIALSVVSPFVGLPLLIGARKVALDAQSDPIGFVQKLLNWRNQR